MKPCASAPRMLPTGRRAVGDRFPGPDERVLVSTFLRPVGGAHSPSQSSCASPAMRARRHHAATLAANRSLGRRPKNGRQQDGRRASSIRLGLRGIDVSTADWANGAVALTTSRSGSLGRDKAGECIRNDAVAVRRGMLVLHRHRRCRVAEACHQFRDSRSRCRGEHGACGRSPWNVMSGYLAATLARLNSVRNRCVARVGRRCPA